MKYIRTKDGIEPLYIDEFTEEGKEYYKNCKVADTIEELCDYETHYDHNDEFVIRPVSHVDWESLKKVIVNKWFTDCKLAIKTEKGLIYVAKMNDKGELELL